MRIKLDENLPSSLVETLVQLGHDADSVQEEGLQGSSSRRALKAYIESLFRAEDVEGWARCFVVATETKIRVRRSEPNR